MTFGCAGLQGYEITMPEEEEVGAFVLARIALNLVVSCIYWVWYEDASYVRQVAGGRTGLIHVDSQT